MRTGIRWTLSTLFILLLPIWLLLLVPRLNGFGPEPLKHELGESDAYEQLSILLHQGGDQPESGQAEVTDQALVILRSALTADYIEAKSNSVIDEATAWITGQSADQPVLDLNDIKYQVLTAYPDAQIQIDELQANLAKAQQDLKDNPMPVDGVEGLESDGSASTIEIAKMLQDTGSLNNFIAGDFRISLGAPLTPFYDFYQYYQLALPILGILIALLLICISLLQKGWLARIRSLGWLLIVGAVVNGILSAIFSVAVLKIGLDMAIGMLPGQAEVVGSIGQAVIQSVFANYAQLELIMTATLLIAGIFLILGSIFASKRLSSKVASTTHLPDNKVENKSTSSRISPGNTESSSSTVK